MTKAPHQKLARPKVTVGRIVHFYEPTIGTGGYNDVGIGPYAAIVTQVFRDIEMASLVVLPPTMSAMTLGPVQHYDPASGDPQPTEPYWVWPH